MKDLANNTQLAHLGQDGRKQPLSEHLLQVSLRTSRLAAKIKLPHAGELIGLLHDAGKATGLFQEYLRSHDAASGLEPQDELQGKIDHSTAGAQILWRALAGKAEDKLSQELAGLLVLPVVSHHSGLIDCVEPDGGDRLRQRLAKPDKETRAQESWATLDAEVRSRAETLLNEPALYRELRQAARYALHGERNQQAIDRHHQQLGLMVRLLFSCLIDADRTNTAEFERPGTAPWRRSEPFTAWPLLLQRLEAGLAQLPVEGDVNRIRRDISAACAHAGARGPGTYRLTVPTGGGKTLAALRFALCHAQARLGGAEPVEHILFISPYISIVEQNAAVARRVLETEGTVAGSVVLEHHSNLPRDASPQTREHWRHKVLAENWDAPVVFTTMAQVLEALFGGGTRAVRRLHAMARSVIVFDEAQTLPIKLLHLFNNAMNYLVRECGTTVLLCTATQPQLDALNPEHGALRLSADAEVMDGIAELFRSLRRYTVVDETERPGGWTHADVVEAACVLAQEHGSCLVVLNTKKDVREVFRQCRERLPEAFCVHLSTAMCPVHRGEALEALIGQLHAEGHGRDSRPVLCVSTNLIEAGVDIDFATVVRDLAGLDSLAQAAGRCNRHGLRTAGGRVLLVRLPDPAAQLEDVLHGRKAAQQVLGQWRRAHPGEPFPLDSPEPMDRYFKILHHERRNEMSYAVNGKDAVREDTLLSMLGNNDLAVHDAAAQGRPIERAWLRQSFASAANAFQLIAPTEGVVVPYGNGGKDVVNDLGAAHDLEAEWHYLRKAQRFTLSLHTSAFQQLVQAGSAYEVRTGSGVYCLRPEWYDPEFGLREDAGPLEVLIG